MSDRNFGIKSLSLQQNRILSLPDHVNVKPIVWLSDDDLQTERAGDNQRSVVLGQCCDFDGTDDYIEIPDDDIFTFSDGSTDLPFSVSAWVKLDDVTNAGIISKDDISSNREWYFSFIGEDIRLLVMTDTSNWIGRESTDVHTSIEGTWTHLCATYDGSEVVGGIKLYVNGVLIAMTNVGNGSYTGMANLDATLCIGNIGTGAAYSADGKFFDVRLYNRVLTPTEIRRAMNGLRAGGEIGWWKLDEGTHVDVFDSSGNGNHGTAESVTLSTFRGTYSDLPICFLNDYGYSPMIWLDESWHVNESGFMPEVLSPGDSNFTVEVYAKIDTDTTAGHALISSYTSTSFAYWRILYSTGGRVYAQLRDDAANALTYWSDPAYDIVDGNWHHIAMVIDRTAEKIYLYVDGDEKGGGGGDISAFTGPIACDTNVFYFGHATYTFDCMVHSARFSLIARDADQLEYVTLNGLSIDDDTTALFRVHNGALSDVTGTYMPARVNSDVVYLPRDESDPSKDVLGVDLFYKGRAKYEPILASNCAEFLGTNEYITTVDDDLLSFGDGSSDSAFSVSAWINMVDATSFPVVRKYDGTQREYMLWVDSVADKLDFILFDEVTDGSIRVKTYGGLTGRQGEWIHVVGTYDGSGSETGLHLYINGFANLDLDQSLSGTYNAMTNSTTVLLIGQYASAYAEGKMCDVRIFDTELTSAEVLDVMNGLATGHEVGWWPLSEGAGRTIYDVSGNGLHGSITNATLATFWVTQPDFHFNLNHGFSDALYYDGSSAYGIITDDDPFDFGTNDITIEAWLSVDSAGSGERAFFSKYHQTNLPRWTFYIDSSHYVKFYMQSSGGSCTLVSMDHLSTLDLFDKPIHVAVVVDRDTGAYMYINGELSNSEETAEWTDRSADDFTNTEDVYLGCRQSTTGVRTSYFQGTIHALRFSEIARNADEIYRIYTDGLEDDSDVTAMWEFKKGEGFDSGPNRNDWALTNTERVRIPADVSDTEIDLFGYPLEHISGRFHNDAETTIDFTGGVSSPIMNNINKGYGEFNGTSDFATIPDTTVLAMGDGSEDVAFSISVWCNFTDVTSSIILGNTGGEEWRFVITTGNDISLQLYDISVPAWIRQISDNPIGWAEGQWILLTATYDGLGASAGITLYVNGDAVDSSDDSSGVYVAMQDYSTDYYIGKIGSNYFNGKMRDLRVWKSKELSAQEVKSLYLNNEDPDPDYLVAYYPLHRDTLDYSKNALHAVNTGISFPKYTVPTAHAFGDSIAEPLYKRNRETDAEIICGTAGLYIYPSITAYGVWEFELLKGSGANVPVVFFISNTEEANSSGYNISISAGGVLSLNEVASGTPSSLLTTAADYVVDTWYKIKIMRNSVTDEYVTGAVGTFVVYVDDEAVTAATGTNPVTDNTYTEGTFFILNLDATDRIRNIMLDEVDLNYARFRDDTGVYKINGSYEDRFVMFESPLTGINRRQLEVYHKSLDYDVGY